MEVAQHLVVSTTQAWLGTAMRLQVFGRFVVLYHLLFLVPFDVASCSIVTARAEFVSNNKYEYLDSQKQLMHTIIYRIKGSILLFFVRGIIVRLKNVKEDTGVGSVS
jgi:hypothetical protein